MHTVLNALPMLFHLTLKAVLWDQHSYYPSFQMRKQF